MNERENSIYLILGEMRGDIKALLLASQENKDELKTLNYRVSTLENFRHRLLGMAAVISAIVGGVIAMLVKFWNL